MLGACLPIVQGARFGPHLSCLGNKSSSTFTVCVCVCVGGHMCVCACVQYSMLHCNRSNNNSNNSSFNRRTGSTLHSSSPRSELTCLLLVKTYNLRVISCHTKRTCNPPSHLLFAYSTFVSPPSPLLLPSTAMPCVLKVLTQKLDS